MIIRLRLGKEKVIFWLSFFKCFEIKDIGGYFESMLGFHGGDEMLKNTLDNSTHSVYVQV